MGLEREREGLEVSILEKETRRQRLRVRGIEKKIVRERERLVIRGL